MEFNKAAFLDRDGVINKDYGYVHKWENFDFCEGVTEGLKNLIELKFKLIIITNQSGIDQGIFTEEDFASLTNLMLKKLRNQGIKITDIFHCPHHPLFSLNKFSECECRKPKPGLFLKAASIYNISLNHSIAVGDKERDLKAAKSAGIPERYLIKTNALGDKEKVYSQTNSFESLLDCSRFLKNKCKK